jgi:hypothetical protein
MLSLDFCFPGQALNWLTSPWFRTNG